MIPRDKVDTKKLFDLDSDVSDEDSVQESGPQTNAYQTEEGIDIISFQKDFTSKT